MKRTYKLESWERIHTKRVLTTYIFNDDKVDVLTFD